MITMDSGAQVPEDEPVFILRAQDISSAALVQLWMSLNPQVDPEKMKSAQTIYERMKSWPRKKRAD